MSINTTTGTADDHASTDDSCVDAMYQRLRQIEVERVKVLNDVHNLSASQGLDKLNTAVRRLTALERYSQRSHSKLKQHIFEQKCEKTFARNMLLQKNRLGCLESDGLIQKIGMEKRTFLVALPANWQSESK